MSKIEVSSRLQKNSVDIVDLVDAPTTDLPDTFGEKVHTVDGCLAYQAGFMLCSSSNSLSFPYAFLYDTSGARQALLDSVLRDADVRVGGDESPVQSCLRPLSS